MGAGIVEVSTDTAVSLTDFLPFRLAVAAEAVSRLMTRACEGRFGLSLTASRVLLVLPAAASLPEGEILARTRAEKLELGEALAGLIARGLTAREGEGGIILTEAGRSLQADLGSLALAAEAALLAGLAPNEVRTAHRLLGRIEEAALKLLGQAA